MTSTIMVITVQVNTQLHAPPQMLEMNWISVVYIWLSNHFDLKYLKEDRSRAICIHNVSVGITVQRAI